MDAKEAADAARNYITAALPGLDPAQLGLEEVVPDPARRDWRVTFSFPPPGGQQGQQSASAPRSYKEIIISDADGSVISMTDRAPYASKPVSAGKSRSSPSTSGGWWYGFRSLWLAFVLIPGALIGWTTLAAEIFRATRENPTIDDTIILVVYVVGMIAGLVIARSRYQQASNNKGKCCCCKPAGR